MTSTRFISLQYQSNRKLLLKHKTDFLVYMLLSTTPHRPLGTLKGPMLLQCKGVPNQSSDYTEILRYKYTNRHSVTIIYVFYEKF